MDDGTDYSLIGHPKRVELLAALRRQRAELDARETRLLAAMAADPVPGTRYRRRPSDRQGMGS